MKTQINNPEDGVEFAKQIIKEGVSFHPDDDFRDIINFSTGEKIYTQKESNIRNNLLNQFFVVCQKEGKDIYDLINDVLKKQIGLSY